MALEQRSLRDLTVSAMGLGCMGMSEFYGATDDTESVKVIHRALDAGCTFLDTADMYGPFTNERLVGRAARRATSPRATPADAGSPASGTSTWITTSPSSTPCATWPGARAARQGSWPSPGSWPRAPSGPRSGVAGEDIVPIPGTKRLRYLEENLGATGVSLDAGDLAWLDANVAPASGDRYSDMGTVNR